MGYLKRLKKGEIQSEGKKIRIFKKKRPEMNTSGKKKNWREKGAKKSLSAQRKRGLPLQKKGKGNRGGGKGRRTLINNRRER